MRKFLTAEWTNLVMFNYAVDPALLGPYVPGGTELDCFNGKTYISLVAFEFNRTTIRGLPVPFHQRFEEVNLRFYVKRQSKRGVVFIRELVPKSLVAVGARLMFNENYTCVPMSHQFERSDHGQVTKAQYSWRTKASRCVMDIEMEGPCFIPADGSESQFITEHYWGYSVQKDGTSLEYEVQHPKWSVRSAKSASFSGDPAELYGPAFSRILLNKPDSAFLADGSTVTVFEGSKIRS